MAKKNFTDLTVSPVYEDITDATAAVPVKKTRKQPAAYTDEDALEMRKARTTQGRKGCGSLRINMSFEDEIHDFIRTMARVSGISITEFTAVVFKEYMENHKDLYEKAKAFRDSL